MWPRLDAAERGDGPATRARLCSCERLETGSGGSAPESGAAPKRLQCFQRGDQKRTAGKKRAGVPGSEAPREPGIEELMGGSSVEAPLEASLRPPRCSTHNVYYDK